MFVRSPRVKYFIVVDMLENCDIVPPDASSVYTPICLALWYAVLTKFAWMPYYDCSESRLGEA